MLSQPIIRNVISLRQPQVLPARELSKYHRNFNAMLMLMLMQSFQVYMSLQYKLLFLILTFSLFRTKKYYALHYQQGLKDSPYLSELNIPPRKLQLIAKKII